MAKPTTVKIKLVSTADTGYFYVTKKNPRTMNEKMTVRKCDPRVRKHVEFKEAKIKRSEEHTVEIQSLTRISYAVFCLKKKNIKITVNRQIRVSKMQTKQ